MDLGSLEIINLDNNIIYSKGVTRDFDTESGRIKVLKGIDIEVPNSALTILKGRSGSGKTTLLNIISALDRPTGGKVFFDNEDITTLSDTKREKIRRQKVGFIFQSVALIPIMTAYENIDFALRLAGYEGDRNARIEQVLSYVGLKERMMHFPTQMSGGEQQRVAIARAIAHCPRLIVADEPTGALDTLAGLRVMELFRELIDKEGITIVMTTHDPNLMEMGDVVYEIGDGEIINHNVRAEDRDNG